MGLNIRGLIETGKRENGCRKMGMALFSAGPESIGTGPVYSGCIGALYKGRKINRIILAKVVDPTQILCVNRDISAQLVG
jgi:hypothetical protein